MTFAGWAGHGWKPPEDCPNGPHRGPEGPNEDLGQCPICLAPSHSMRTEGEEYGGPIADCSLERRHEGRCKPGGEGHPPPAVVRGYWPDETTEEQA
jgi:hypothetical protein